MQFERLTRGHGEGEREVELRTFPPTPEGQRGGWFWRWPSDYSPDGYDWHGPYKSRKGALRAEGRK